MFLKNLGVKKIEVREKTDVSNVSFSVKMKESGKNAKNEWCFF